MSHTATYAQKVTDINLFCQTASELGHKVEIAKQGETLTVPLFGSNSVPDAVAKVHLKDWCYPIAINNKGEILYDHWGSKANTIEHLGKALQTYNHKLVIGNIDYTQIVHEKSVEDKDGNIVMTLTY